MKVRNFILSVGLIIFSLPCLAAEQPGASLQLTPEEQKYFVAYPPINYGDGSKRALIDRGEYLAKAGDCIACHTDTKNGGSAYAGGLPIETPFGTFYSPNISPDKETGIGKWTDADFIRAMRNGLSPHHQNYFPVFPYPYFGLLSDDDLRAIKAYLFSIPAESRENRKIDIPFPLNIRFFQYGWKFLFFYPRRGEFVPNPKQSKEWNRGAYLVEGLGHCGLCHSPLNIFGAEKKAYAYTGNFIEGYFAPNISASGLKDVSVEEIVDVFKKNKMLKGKGKVEGPMLDVNVNSLRYLSDDDLRSIAIYLKTVKSKVMKPKSKRKITADTGKEIYEDKCAICHTTGASGSPVLGDQNAWVPRIKQGVDTVVKHAINGINSMPPKGACMSCSDEEIKATVLYMLDLEKLGSASKKMAAAAIPTESKLSMEVGKKVYTETCSVCHEDGKLGAPKFGDKAAWAPIVRTDMDILFKHALEGYKGMPPKGACYKCSNSEVLSAVKYMAQAGATQNDFTLW